ARPPRSPQPAAHRLAGRWPRGFCLWTSFRIPLVALRSRGGAGPRVERQMVGLVLHSLFRTRLRLRGSVAAPPLRHQAFHHGHFASRCPRLPCFSRCPAYCLVSLVVAELVCIGDFRLPPRRGRSHCLSSFCTAHAPRYPGELFLLPLISARVARFAHHFCRSFPPVGFQTC